MSRTTFTTIALTLLVMGIAVFLVTASFASLPRQHVADNPGKGLSQNQGRRAKKVEDPRTSPANNYGFSEATPFGDWSARVEIDSTQSPNPYVPVVVSGIRSYAGKGGWGKQLMIESVTLKNRTPRVVTSVKLAWIILTKESRNARKNQEAAIVRGNTALLNQEWNNDRPFRKVKSLFIDFVKEAKSLIKGGSLSGDFYIRLRVSEVQFEDGSTWREGDALALRKKFAHAASRAAQPQTPNCQTQQVCFFHSNGLGTCEFDQLSTQFCRMENCNQNEPEACFCNLHNCPDCRDNDGDGVFDCEGDCDDANPRRFPGNDEDRPGNCSDGVDNDCDDDVDCADILCIIECSTGSCSTRPCSGPAVCDEQQWCPAGSRWCASTCECRCNVSPILVDLNGDGFDLTPLAGGVLFNIFNDGNPKRLAWTVAGSDDAWLTLDRNGNGTVDNGPELFGNLTPQSPSPTGEEKNGFLALAEFDKPAKGGNSDGFIDSRDAIFSSLRLWQDVNHNALSESAELHRLAEFGITSIDLNYKESRRKDRYGNEFRFRSKLGGSGSVARYAWDVFLTYW